MRAALEALAVRQVIASPRRQSAVAPLREALEHLADGGEDPAARMQADLAFHQLLCRLSGNSMLVEAWERLEGRMRVAILNGASWRVPMMAHDRHAPIVDAIKQADATAAVAIVEEHMTAAAEHFARNSESA